MKGTVPCLLAYFVCLLAWLICIEMNWMKQPSSPSFLNLRLRFLHCLLVCMWVPFLFLSFPHFQSSGRCRVRRTDERRTNNERQSVSTICTVRYRSVWVSTNGRKQIWCLNLTFVCLASSQLSTLLNNIVDLCWRVMNSMFIHSAPQIIICFNFAASINKIHRFFICVFASTCI